MGNWNRIRKATCIGALTLAMSPAVAKAQDFYNGVRGPSSVQIDNYATHNGGETDGIVIPKLFTKRLLVAAPFGISRSEGADNKGVNIGYIAENASEKNKAIIALGLFKDGEGNYEVLNPQAYFTRMQGPWTLDLEAQAPLHLGTHEITPRAAATVGYGLNDRWRIGGSAALQEGGNSSFQAIARYEIREDHKVWAQAYVGEDRVGIRLAVNL